MEKLTPLVLLGLKCILQMLLFLSVFSITEFSSLAELVHGKFYCSYRLSVLHSNPTLIAPQDNYASLARL